MVLNLAATFVSIEIIFRILSLFLSLVVIYKRGPRYYHASCIIIVHPKSDRKYISITDLKGLQRIAETSDKDVLLLEVTKPNALNYNIISEIAAIKITETIIRRFSSTSFVQSQNITK